MPEVPVSSGATRRGGYALDGLNFFIAATQACFGVFVTVHLVRNHWPAQDIGLALTTSTVASLLGQIPAGALIDAMRDKRMAVLTGVSGVGAAALLLALSPTRPAVYIAQVLQGLGSTLIAPGIAAISLAAVGHAAFSERIGRNARFASIGAGLTAGVMGFAGSYFQPVSIFWFAAAQTIPALLCASLAGHFGGRPPAVEGGADEPGQDETRLSWKGVRSLVTDRRLLVFAACILLFFVASAAMLPIVAGRVTMRNPRYATLIVAATMLLPQAIVAAVSPWVGRTAERSGRRPMLLFGWGLVPLQGVLYAALPEPGALVVCQVLNGFSSAVFGVMMTVVAADLTRGTGRFNLTLGALGAAVSVGASISTFFAGIMAAAVGLAAAFLGLAVAGLLGVTLLWLGVPETGAKKRAGQAASDSARSGVSQHRRT
jgi:MFS family permease